MIYLTVLKRRWSRIEVSSTAAHVLDTSLNRALVDILIFLSSRFIVCAKTNNKMFKSTVFLVQEHSFFNNDRNNSCSVLNQKEQKCCHKLRYYIMIIYLQSNLK